MATTGSLCQMADGRQIPALAAHCWQAEAQL